MIKEKVVIKLIEEVEKNGIIEMTNEDFDSHFEKLAKEAIAEATEVKKII